ncbi:MAG: acetylxylan esterase, partial [Candidatus Tectomicrobia bacterium]|nr:acetylxylan esterase [Candidatus Tectomicrobia bacterium]
NIVDKHTYSYRGFYVDVWRAVDFLLSRPEVDPNRIGITGSSQGGALTIVTAAMRHEIRAAAAGAPYLCGMMDAIRLTHTYPYQEINDYLRLYPEREKQVRETLSYFDGINFADKIRCPIIVNIGLNDDVCPPETGYALFNVIGSPEKKLYPYENCGHDAGSAFHTRIVTNFLDEQLK